MAPKSYQIAHIYCLFFLMVVVCIANRDTDNTVKASKFNKDIYINLAKNEEYKEMKKENNYISTDMNHKKLIFGVVIIHVCFMLIGASGILSGADKYDLSVDFDYHDWSGNEAIFDHFI